MAVGALRKSRKRDEATGLSAEIFECPGDHKGHARRIGGKLKRYKTREERLRPGRGPEDCLSLDRNKEDSLGSQGSSENRQGKVSHRPEGIPESQLFNQSPKSFQIWVGKSLILVGFLLQGPYPSRLVKGEAPSGEAEFSLDFGIRMPVWRV